MQNIQDAEMIGFGMHNNDDFFKGNCFDDQRLRDRFNRKFSVRRAGCNYYRGYPEFESTTGALGHTLTVVVDVLVDPPDKSLAYRLACPLASKRQLPFCVLPVDPATR